MPLWLAPLKPFTLGVFLTWAAMKLWKRANEFKCHEIKEFRSEKI